MNPAAIIPVFFVGLLIGWRRGLLLSNVVFCRLLSEAL